ncbi:hypothetical protein [Lacihabitans lacunae]|uniref:Uncharacterized protein n=1 Tax=Lacihabitans lacunae TaxID=1028214 RepID=A0ABV7YSF2_9BACT
MNEPILSILQSVDKQIQDKTEEMNDLKSFAAKMMGHGGDLYIEILKRREEVEKCLKELHSKKEALCSQY